MDNQFLILVEDLKIRKKRYKARRTSKMMMGVHKWQGIIRWKKWIQ